MNVALVGAAVKRGAIYRIATHTSVMEAIEVNTSDPELASVRTLSHLFDISEKTIWDWVYKSRRQPTLDPIPYYKLGGLVRFNLREVRAWVDRRKVRPLAMLVTK